MNILKYLRFGRDRVAFTAFLAILLFCSAISLSVVPVFAQESKEADTQKYFSILQNAYNFILENYVDPLDAEKIFEGAMSGMFDAIGDPYSVFLTRDMMSDLKSKH